MVEKAAAIRIVDFEPNIRNKLSRGNLRWCFLTMLRSYWHKHRKTVGLTAFVAVAVWMIWLIAADLTTVSTTLQKNAVANSSKYALETKNYIERRCVGLPSLDQEKCIREAEDALDTDQRENLDLAAQQITAWWTQVMGIAALIGMGVSIVGVFLVWTTFAETRRGNDIARDSASRQLRAYISMEGVIAERIVPAVQGQYAVTFLLTNSGPTPVVNWRMCCCWKVAESTIDKDFYEAAIAEYGRPPDEWQFSFGPNQSKKVALGVNLSAPHIVQILNKSMRLYVMGLVEYHDVFGDQHTTKFFYAYNVDTEPVFGQMSWHNQMT